MQLHLNARAFETSSSMPVKPVTAMVLDHVLDKLAVIGVEKAVVNVHYLADQIIHHVAERQRPRIVISDERNEILGTGGGVVKALPQLGTAPFFHMNADTLWIDGVRPNLARLAEAFDPARMDMLMLMAPTAASIGYDGRGDYTMSTDGTLHKRKENQIAPFVYAGAAVLSPQLFAAAPKGEFGLPRLFDAAEEAGRLFGLRLEGTWMHVGTPDAIAEAERAVLESVA
jgi:MurNAc alpha-1-phosphate uridylyltransferase